jgi:hypothetical protein
MYFSEELFLLTTPYFVSDKSNVNDPDRVKEKYLEQSCTVVTVFL